MEFKLDRLSEYSDENLISEIIRVDKIINKEKLTKNDFDKHSKVSASTLGRRFGSYGNALKLAGLAHKYIEKDRRISSVTPRSLNDDEVLNELKNIAFQLKKEIITTEDVKNHCKLFGLSTIRSRFKTFENAIALAGLKASKHGKKYSDEEKFDNLLNVWTYYGRIPTFKEMSKEPSKVGGKAYLVRWGTWNKALHAFVEFVNNEPQEENLQVIDYNSVKKELKKVLEEDKREIKVGLRYKILVRDNFKCVRCGASPVTDFGCKLVIDHKIPFSLGGKTTFENLETKCEVCNLGKGNRFIE